MVHPSGENPAQAWTRDVGGCVPTAAGLQAPGGRGGGPPRQAAAAQEPEPTETAATGPMPRGGAVLLTPLLEHSATHRKQSSAEGQAVAMGTELTLKAGPDLQTTSAVTKRRVCRPRDRGSEGGSRLDAASRPRRL